jgi:transcriptional regulator with XRE-family HTH domain
VPQVPRLERAAQLLGLGEDIDPWEALQDDVLRPRNGTMADVLTPLSARMLAVAAARVVERGWDDLIAYGDRVFPRLDGGPMQGEDSFLWGLPPLCDGQSAAWRLAMVRAVENLGDDLKAGRAPLPTCTAEELAFHLILAEGHALLNDMGDPYYARQLGLPTRDRFTVRHRAFDRWCEAFLQDTDVLLHYDERLALIASDPDHPVSRQLGTGDLRPRAWFAPFGNIRRRSPRPLTDKERGVLAYADPDAFFASTPALSAEGTLPAHADDSAIRLPEGLREEFEHFIGLAQRRFFDEPCAIAMAVSLDRLLTRLFDTEAVVPSHVWPLNPRARAVRAGILIVDHDFCLRGYSRTWRLSADRSDREARDWAVDLLDDCAQYIIARRGQIYDEFLPTRALSDAQVSQLRELLPVRLRDLARDLTVAGLLHHRAQRLGLSVNELAELALLPEPLVAGWLNGVPASPSQLLRCAPALQVSEDALLAALDGKRDTHCWPLPIPPPDRQGHSESATGMPATGEHSMPTLTRTSSRCSSDHD